MLVYERLKRVGESEYVSRWVPQRHGVDEPVAKPDPAVKRASAARSRAHDAAMACAKARYAFTLTFSSKNVSGDAKRALSAAKRVAVALGVGDYAIALGVDPIPGEDGVLYHIHGCSERPLWECPPPRSKRAEDPAAEATESAPTDAIADEHGLVQSRCYCWPMHNAERWTRYMSRQIGEAKAHAPRYTRLYYTSVPAMERASVEKTIRVVDTDTNEVVDVIYQNKAARRREERENETAHVEKPLTRPFVPRLLSSMRTPLLKAILRASELIVLVAFYHRRP